MKLKKLLRHCNKTKKIFFKRYDDGITYLSSGDIMAQLNYKGLYQNKQPLNGKNEDDCSCKSPHFFGFW